MQLQYYFLLSIWFMGCVSDEKMSKDSGITDVLNNDADGDGYETDQDCDDNNSAIHPMAEEICDGLDNNCDQEIDEGDICPCAYRSFDGAGYFFCEQTVVWAEAVAACPEIREGYDLLSINDDSEDIWIYEQFIEIDAEQRWWISLNDQDEEGIFLWGNGDVPKYTNWGTAEPNDSGGEDCAELNRFYDETWNDIRCNAELYYICEGPR